MIRVLDLFSGIGGFALGMQMAGGYETVAFCECDPYCVKVLNHHWPNVPVFPDVRTITAEDLRGLGRIDMVCGGDPCQSHSRARANKDSMHPDLSGFFFSVAARCSARWMVRENVPSPGVAEFARALECIGYGACVVRGDAATFTGQSRQRDFVVGCLGVPTVSLYAGLLAVLSDDPEAYETRLGTRQVVACLTCHRTRYDSRDSYVYEDGRLRILSGDERDAFSGFGEGWTAGFSEATRARLCGQTVVPQVVEQIARAIREADGPNRPAREP